MQEDSPERLMTDLKGTDTLPLWAQMAKLNPPEPNPKTIPHIWKYGDIKPNLLRAGHLITEKQAERRVLMLINPGRGRRLFTGHVGTPHLTTSRSTLYYRYIICWPPTRHA